jgi:hypothetical protein
MLQIRPEQMQSLSTYTICKFEDRMVLHLNKYFPEQCKKLGEDGTRKAVRYGLQRAAGYEITSERDVCIYIDVMFEFGRNFDLDPRLPWASEILNDEGLAGEPSEKVNELYDTAMENIKRASGIELDTEV